MGIDYEKYVETADGYIDKVWYNSTDILYSECLDKENEFKQLKVIFKGGGTYLYKDVDVNDYLFFKVGGLNGSVGKTLNERIKPKYEFEKLDTSDTELINEVKGAYKTTEARNKQIRLFRNDSGKIYGLLGYGYDMITQNPEGIAILIETQTGELWSLPKPLIDGTDTTSQFKEIGGKF